MCYLPDVNLADKEVYEDNSMPIVAIEVGNAKLLAVLFKKAYGESIQLMSELTVRPLVGGEEWTKKEGENLFQSSDLRWIIPVLLAVFANYGGQARGAQTKRFQEVMDILRESKVSLVGSLERSVWRGNECIIKATAHAYWSSKAGKPFSTLRVPGFM